MSDFLRELEEDIKEERIVNLWRKYGNLVIGIALAIVIGTVSYTLWMYFKHKSQLRSHVSFSQAVELVNQGKKEEALKAFQDISTEKGGYGKLAVLYEAALVPDPETVYTKISQSNAGDPALSNLPKILMAARPSANSTAFAAIESLAAPNNAWAPLALALLALEKLKHGESVKAAEDYFRILEQPFVTIPEQIRASLMLSQVDVPFFVQEEHDEKDPRS
jgi:hypothetical protein